MLHLEPFWPDQSLFVIWHRKLQNVNLLNSYSLKLLIKQSARQQTLTIAKSHLFNYKTNIVADKFTFTNPRCKLNIPISRRSLQALKHNWPYITIH